PYATRFRSPDQQRPRQLADRPGEDGRRRAAQGAAVAPHPGDAWLFRGPGNLQVLARLPAVGAGGYPDCGGPVWLRPAVWLPEDCRADPGGEPAENGDAHRLAAPPAQHRAA